MRIEVPENDVNPCGSGSTTLLLRRKNALPGILEVFIFLSNFFNVLLILGTHRLREVPARATKHCLSSLLNVDIKKITFP
jgi:hypothetical protein